MMLQELSTAMLYDLPVKVIVLNNGHLGMVRQWQELFWEGKYAGTSYEAFQPSFAEIAKAYGMPGTTITDEDDLEDTACVKPSPTTGPPSSTSTPIRWRRCSQWSRLDMVPTR